MSPDSRRAKLTQKQTELFAKFWFFVFVFFFFGAALLLSGLHPRAVETATTDVPTIVTYQGKLFEGGNAVTTTKAMAFLIYDASSGGNLLYTAAGSISSTSTINVTPTSGVFSVELGGSGTNSIDPDIFQQNSGLYLQIIIGNEALTPRKRLTSAPYAFNAQYLMGVAATSTASSSQYIPISDENGYFNFSRVGINSSTPGVSLASSGTAYFALNANDRVIVDGSTINNMPATAGGVVEVNYDAAVSSTAGVVANIAIDDATTNAVGGFFANVTGRSAGLTSGNQINAFMANLTGDDDDTNVVYNAFQAFAFSNNGGTSDARAFNAGTGYEYLLWGESGNIWFDNYDATIEGTGGSITIDGEQGLSLNTNNNEGITAGTGFFNITGSLGVSSTAEFAGNLNASSTVSLATTTVDGQFAASSNAASSTFSGGLETDSFAVTGSASSTFANGIVLNGGCVLYQGSCLTASAALWEAGTNGTFEDDAAVIVGSDALFTYASGGAGDLRVSDELEVIGTSYFGGAVQSSSTLLVDGTSTLATTTVTRDLTVDTDTLVVDSLNDRVGINTSTPSASFSASGTSYFGLNAGDNVIIDGTSIQNAPGALGGVLEVLYGGLSGSSAGITSRLTVDDAGANNTLGGYLSNITGAPGGSSGDNIISGYISLLAGDGDDTDVQYEGFTAFGFNKNGGTSEARAFHADTGWDYLLYGASGDIYFDSYSPTIEVSGGTLSLESNQGLNLNTTNNTAITAGTGFFNITGSLGVSSTAEFAGNLNASSTVSLATTSVFGDLAVDTDTLYVDSVNNRVGINSSSPSASLTVDLPASGDVLGDGISIFRGSGFFNMGQGTSNVSEFTPIIRAKGVGDRGLFIRGIQSDTQVNAAAMRFSAANATEDGAIASTDNAFEFYNWADNLLTITGDGEFLVDNNAAFVFTDSLSNNVNKDALLAGKHYNNTQEDVLMFWGQQQATINNINFGGGSALFNAATGIHFYTAANNTTLTGTERLTITGSGNIGVNTTTPSASFSASGTSYFALNANDNVIIDGTSIQNAPGALGGVLEVSYGGISGSSAGITSNLRVDDAGANNTLGGYLSNITGAPGGSSGDNIISGYISLLAGDDSDTDVQYEGFTAFGFNDNGGTSEARAFHADTGWDYLLYGASGNIYFDNYSPTIQASGGTISIDSDQELNLNMVNNANITLGSGRTTITGSLGVTSTLDVDDGTLYVDAANNRVGVNTSTPNSSFAVSGTSTFSGVTHVTGRSDDPIISSSTQPSSFSSPSGVDVSGDYAYVLSQGALDVIDISDPDNPAPLDSLSDTDLFADVSVQGKYAYVGSSGAQNTVSVVDISDPFNMQIVGSVASSTGLNFPRKVEAAGNYLYFAGGSGQGIFSIIDISDPTDPILLKSVSSSLFGTELHDVVISGDYAYVPVNVDDRVVIIDISDPSNAVVVGSVTDATVLNGVFSVDVEGSYVYTISNGAGLNAGYLGVIDISDPANPSVVGNLNGLNFITNTGDIAAAGDYVYIKDRTSGGDGRFRVVNVKTKTNPVLMSTISSLTISGSDEIVLSGNYAYALGLALHIIDISGARISNADIGSAKAANLQVMGTALFDRNLDVRGGLSVGSSGLLLSGAFGMSVSSTASDLIFSVQNTGNKLFSILGNGNIGIGTSTPNAAFSINSNAVAAGTNVFEIYSDVATDDDLVFRVTATGTVIADGQYDASGADYAEYFYTLDTDLKPGETVCVDIANENAVRRCLFPADGNVMGIISSRPSIVGNSTEKHRNNPNYVIVGMMGQVPAKVSDENGPIRVGDSLTSASVPGYAMRAKAGDPTVGVALQKLESGTGTIQVLISRRNKSLTVETVEEQITDRIAAMEIEDEVELLVSSAVDQLDLNDEISIIVDETFHAMDIPGVIDARLDDLNIGGLIDEAIADIDVVDMITSNVNPIRDILGIPGLIETTVSSTALQDQPVMTNLLGKAEATDIALAELTLQDEDILSNINSLEEKILLLEGMQGTVGEEIQGEWAPYLNVGELTVQKSLVVLGDLRVEKHSVFSGDTVGQAKILAGDNAVKVTFDQPYEYQPIITLTLRGESALATSTELKYTVVDESTKGFTIRLNTAQEDDILFNWHAFGAEAAKIFVSDNTVEDIQIVLEEDPEPAPVEEPTPVPPADTTSTTEESSDTSDSESGDTDSTDTSSETDSTSDGSSSGTTDTSSTDTSGTDSGSTDTGAPDTSTTDTSESESTDTSSTDTSSETDSTSDGSSSGTTDTSSTDTSGTDSGSTDTSSADTSTSDTSSGDTGSTDTSSGDTSASDSSSGTDSGSSSGDTSSGSSDGGTSTAPSGGGDSGGATSSGGDSGGSSSSGGSDGGGSSSSSSGGSDGGSASSGDGGGSSAGE